MDPPPQNPQNHSSPPFFGGCFLQQTRADDDAPTTGLQAARPRPTQALEALASQGRSGRAPLAGPDSTWGPAALYKRGRTRIVPRPTPQSEATNPSFFDGLSFVS